MSVEASTFRTDIILNVSSKAAAKRYLVKHNLINESVVSFKKLIYGHFQYEKDLCKIKSRFWEWCKPKESEYGAVGSSSSLNYFINVHLAIRMLLVFRKKNLVHNYGINDIRFNEGKRHEHLLSYKRWTGIMQRCYDPISGKDNAYHGVTVSDEWRLYSKFKTWFDKHYTDGYVLDKDILFKYNREYSEHRCVFVPKRINNLLINNKASRGELPIGVYAENSTGRIRFGARLSKSGEGRVFLGYHETPEKAFFAFKSAKEAYIKDVAMEYFDNKLIDSKVLNALFRYKVDIDD